MVRLVCGFWLGGKSVRAFFWQNQVAILGTSPDRSGNPPGAGVRRREIGTDSRISSWKKIESYICMLLRIALLLLSNDWCVLKYWIVVCHTLLDPAKARAYWWMWIVDYWSSTLLAPAKAGTYWWIWIVTDCRLLGFGVVCLNRNNFIFYREQNLNCNHWI